MQASDRSVDLEGALSADARPDPLPEQLDSPVAKLVYLYLSAVGPASPDELSAALRLRKLTVYPVLDHLSSEDLLSRRGGTYRI